jgi:hypothetical protein
MPPRLAGNRLHYPGALWVHDFPVAEDPTSGRPKGQHSMPSRLVPNPCYQRLRRVGLSLCRDVVEQRMGCPFHRDAD